MPFIEFFIALTSFLPFWATFLFMMFIFIMLGILIFKVVAFVMDVLPFV